MESVYVSPLAFAKIILHASKYPHAAINGILLGKAHSDGSVSVSDSIPLFHACLTLTPMLEVALYQIEAYSQSKGLKICGYYQANENVFCNSINPIAIKIADKISVNCGHACVLMVRNDKIKQLSTDVFSLYVEHDEKWQEFNDHLTVEKSGVDLLKPLLNIQSLAEFADFDNHLDDITMDWRNIDLFQNIPDAVESLQ